MKLIIELEVLWWQEGTKDDLAQNCCCLCVYNYPQEIDLERNLNLDIDSHCLSVGWCYASWFAVAKDEQHCMEDMLQMYRATRRQKKEDGNSAM